MKNTSHFKKLPVFATCLILAISKIHTLLLLIIVLFFWTSTLQIKKKLKKIE